MYTFIIQNWRQTCIRQIGNIDYLIAYNMQFSKMYRFANLQKTFNEIIIDTADFTNSIK